MNYNWGRIFQIISKIFLVQKVTNDLNFYSLNCVFKMEFKIRKFSKFRKLFKMNFRNLKNFKTCILGVYAHSTTYACPLGANIWLEQSYYYIQSIGIGAQNVSLEIFQNLKFILNNFRNLKKFWILNFILKTQFKL